MVISGEEETLCIAYLCHVWIFILNMCFFVIKKVEGTKWDSKPQGGQAPRDMSGQTSCAMHPGPWPFPPS